MDVLWFRVSRERTDPGEPIGRFDGGRIIIMINRGEYWQCGFIIPKGGYEETKKKGLEEFRKSVAIAGPMLKDRVEEIKSWDDVHLLTVVVDRLNKWHRPGVLCIGDAAHAMSPVGGVGINLAVQDAVATANILAEPLRSGTVEEKHLAAVESRRTYPTVMTQRGQVMIQRKVIGRALASDAKMTLPFVLRVLQWIPILRRVPGRLVGLGFRPEHVETRDAFQTG
jgi:2-polyprenyl-6-methoxyphenol hydroxylase-like FAD-dependent oxidoreductase